MYLNVLLTIEVQTITAAPVPPGLSIHGDGWGHRIMVATDQGIHITDTQVQM